MHMTQITTMAGLVARHIRNIYPGVVDIGFEVRPNGKRLQLVCLAPLAEYQMQQLHTEVLADPAYLGDPEIILTGTLDPPAPRWPEGEIDGLYADYDARDDSMLIPLTVISGTPTHKVPTNTGILLNVQEDGTVVSLELRGIGQMIKDERRIYRQTRKQQKLVA